MIDGSKSIPTETKNNTANASCNGSEFAAALWLKSDSCQDHACEKGPKGKGDAEELRGAKGDPQGDRKNAQSEELARPSACHLL